MPREGSRQARGYGRRHDTERRRWKSVVDAGRANCWRCGQWINPAMPWDLGHDDNDRNQYQGPEHQHCNRSAGAAKGNRRSQTLTAHRW